MCLGALVKDRIHDGKMLSFCLILLIFLPSLYSEQRHVFFLHTYSSSNALPWMKGINDGVDRALALRPGWILHSEYLGWPDTKDGLSNREWCDYISKKYGQIEFSAVLAEASMASSFINSYGEELFGDIPKVLYSVEALEEKPNTFYLKSDQDQSIRETFALAREQNPESPEVFVINNQPDLFGKSMDAIGDLAAREGMTFTVLTDFSRESLLEEMDKLKGDEIVFYFLVYGDNRGNRFIPGEILQDICAHSAAPVYSFWSSLMGRGLAGGVMLDSGKIASEMFQAVDDFLSRGGFAGDYSTLQTYLDWNTVKPHSLQTDNLPEDIIILNRPLPFYSVYYKQILTLGIAVLLLILSLVLFSRHHIVRAHRKLEKMYWLQERQARMGEMMNFVAHQWQQYLYSISLYVNGMVKKELLKPERERHTESLAGIKNTLESMFTTLKNFRNYINPRKNRELFSVSEQCEAVLSLLEDLLSASGVDLTYSDQGDSMVWGVRNELEQVLINLIGNAVNIFKERTIIQPFIILTVTGESDRVLVKIEDNGGGVRPELAEEIFEKYLTTREEGSGLGLYMSRRIIRERFYGSLTLEKGEKGALFIIDIPREPRIKKRGSGR